MSHFARRLAWRYLTQTKYNARMKVMLITCFFGIFIGSFALCLILAIMNGFQYETYKKLQSIHPEIELHAYGKELHATAIKEIITQQFPTIAATSAYDIQNGIVFSDEQEMTTMIILKGICPEDEQRMHGITDKIISPEDTPLTAILQPDTVIIGRKMAQELHKKVGDSIEIYFTPQVSNRKKITLSQKTVTVGGIFFSGIDECDTGLILCDMITLKNMFPESGPTHVGLRVHDSGNINALKEQLQNYFELYAVSWSERYPALIAALTLEKYAMFVILSLILLVAGMNIISLLSMYISSKRVDIALLRVHGFSIHIIQRVFIWFTCTISSAASLCGILCATIASYYIQTYPIIQLPDAYFVSSLPSHMTFSICAIVFLVTMMITAVALCITIGTIRTINIQNILRFEA